jgi:DNA-binding IclR family transcriptional regulator
VSVDIKPVPSKAKNVQAVDRTLAILETLAAHRSPLSLSALAREVALNVSTVHRLLHTLMGRGFVVQEQDTGRYRLGLKAFEIGSAALSALDVSEGVRPVLEELAGDSSETANFAVLEGSDIVYLDQVESHHQVKMLAKLGGRSPSYCTGAGKVILAQLPESELDQAIARISFRAFTASTLADGESLKRELQKVRNRGYAVDLEEMEEGVRCVAAPVFNHFGRAVGAISVSGPSSRLVDEYLEAKLIPLVKAAAIRLSTRLN